MEYVQGIERHQRACVWFGLVFLPLLFFGLLIAGFLIPPAPHLDADAVARLFSDNRNPIRIGILLATLAAPFLAFFIAAISHQIRRIAGGPTSLATAQSIAGACLLLEFIFPQMVWQAAAYRVGRSPEIVQMLNDVAWLCYVGVNGTAIVQMVITAVVLLQDDRSEPLVPRWCGFLSAWCAIGVFGGSFCIFVQRGMLAWDGLIAWWLLILSFCCWMIALSWQMLRASRKFEASHAA